MEAKPWWESKTIWANILTVAIAILLLVADVPDLSPDMRAGLLLAVGIAGIFLRVVTDQPIAAKKPD